MIRVSGQRAGGRCRKTPRTRARAYTHTHTHTHTHTGGQHRAMCPRISLGARELQRANGAKGARQHRGTTPSHSLEGARVKLAKHQTFRTGGEGVDRFGLTATLAALILAVRNVEFVA